jgi:pSer/pThr/pTyr-binding forkhead associated (FHA) protein
MDVGLVCDHCDTFNAMASPACSSCGNPLALGAKRAPRRPASQPLAVAAAAPAAVAASGSAPSLAAVHSRPAMPAPRPCRECGNPVPAAFRFCGTCGARMDAPKPTGDRRTIFFGAMQQARAKLVLIKGDGLDGVSFTLAGKEHVAGRTEGPLLFQDDPFLSPRHANFYYKDDKLVVSDLGSANGVYVRTRGPVLLQTGDVFLIGEQVLRIETTPPETAGLGPDDDGTYVFASPRRASRMRLVQTLRGGDVGLVYRATGDIVSIGRDSNDINFPDDPFISGRHAQVTFGDAGMLLTDLGSKNGTFLRIRQDTTLSHGDYVFMGQQLLRVEIV